jgi:hypothetical protein
MKVLVWAAALTILSAGTLGACSDGSGMSVSMFPSSGTSSGSGSGGAGGGGTTFSTTSNVSASSSSSGAGGAGCNSMPDNKTCVACEAAKHPAGSMLYNALNTCLYCTECYTVCDGMAKGCASAPPMMGVCDGPAPDKTACGDTNMGCVKCAYAGACKAASDACINNQDCLDYNGAISNCPP